MGSLTQGLLRLAAHPANYWGGILLDASIAGSLLVHAMRTAGSGAMEAGLLGFVAYSLVHHILHHRGPFWRLVRVLRHHHRMHHRYPGVNFGVTMTLWDWMFGTHHLGARPKAPR